jgi:hypothetical protein
VGAVDDVVSGRWYMVMKRSLVVSLYKRWLNVSGLMTDIEPT